MIVEAMPIGKKGILKNIDENIRDNTNTNEFLKQ